jgi:hypothetical protein
LLEPDALHAISPLGVFPLSLARSGTGRIIADSIEHCGGRWQAAANGSLSALPSRRCASVLQHSRRLEPRGRHAITQNGQAF